MRKYQIYKNNKKFLNLGTREDDDRAFIEFLSFCNKQEIGIWVCSKKTIGGVTGVTTGGDSYYLI